MDFQGSLFEAPPSGVRSFEGLERRQLSAGAWVDVQRNWVPAPDDAFAALVADVPWRAERRQMYDRVVDVPRLVHNYRMGEPFVTAGCCYYRDGRDSVAWHGDTIGRGRTEDTMVAIVSFGDPRKLVLRPRGGGEWIAIEMGHGDLVVMGGSCQRTWEHAVPKVAHAGPRISVQYRPLNVF